MTEESFTTRRALWRDALLVFALSLAVYAATAPRTIMPEDDGLFILAAYFNGVAHPPGYPLFTLLAHPFSWLPLESIAFRIHLASSAFAASAVLAAWWTMRALPGVSRLGAITGALALALSATFWSQAIIAEVYCLNAALFLLLLGLSIRYLGCFWEKKEPSSRRLYLIAFLLGLSLTNHWPLMVLGGTGLAVMYLPAWRELLRSAPMLVLLVCLGLLPYLWLYFRSQTGIPISFYGPLPDWESFWFMVSRQGYAGVDHKESAQFVDKLAFVGYYFSDLVTQFRLPGLLLGTLGFVWQWKRWPRTLALGLTFSFLATSVLLALLLGFDYSKYYRNIFRVYPIVANAIWAIWIALGVSSVAQVLQRALQELAWRQHFLRAGCGLFVAYLGTSHAALNDGHLDDLADRYARVTLNTLPKNALVFVSGDMYFGPLAYTHILEHVRPDLTLFNPMGLVLGNRLFHPLGVLDDQRTEIIANFVKNAEQPVCVVGDWTYGFAFEENWLFRCLRKDVRLGDNTFQIHPEHLQFLRQLVRENPGDKPWLKALQDGLLNRMGQISTFMVYGDEGVHAGAAVLAAHRDVMTTDYGRLGALNMLLGSIDPNLEHHAILARDIVSNMSGNQGRFEVKEDGASFQYLSGLVHEAVGDGQQALVDYAMAMNTWLDPNNPAAIKLLHELNSDAPKLDPNLAGWLRAREESITRIDRERRERDAQARDPMRSAEAITP